MEFEHEHEHSPSFRRKLKTSILCVSSCCTCDDEIDDEESKALESSPENRKSTPTNLATWIKSELPEIKGLFSGKIGRNRHRGTSADFRYDPLSYALNFEDDGSRFDDQYPLRNFSSRLPPSPPPAEMKNVVVSTFPGRLLRLASR